MDLSFDIVLKLFVLLGLSCHLCTVKGTPVSQTACPNGNECTTITNSACVSTKCKCNDGFNETTTTCTKVIGAACTFASDCSTLVPNSNCSSATCSCLPLYQEKNNMCVKVLGAVCQTNASCSNDIPHSECKTLKCVCAKGYGESDSVCAKLVSATPCTASGTECQSISNSACDKKGLKCKCDAGFKETVNKCTAESKGISLSSTTTTAVTGVMLLVLALNKLF